MTLNFIVILIAALIPMIIGFVWYHPKVMGTVWMEASGMTEEKVQSGNMPLIFGVSYVMSVLLGVAITFIVIHQNHLYSLLMNEPGMMEPGSEIMVWLEEFMAKHGQNFRTFKHGALHGAISGLFFALPILATNALFERKGFKYIAVNAAYWIITISLMGGVICQFS